MRPGPKSGNESATGWRRITTGWCLSPLNSSRLQNQLSGSVSDDIADIWMEVKAGLAAMEKGPEGMRACAVWYWRFSFERHWSRHAAGAIGALSELCYGTYAIGKRPD